MTAVLTARGGLRALLCGFYWKTFDIFTQGTTDIDKAYREGNVTYAFWSLPIPKFVSNQDGTKPEDLSWLL